MHHCQRWIRGGPWADFFPKGMILLLSNLPGRTASCPALPCSVGCGLATPFCTFLWQLHALTPRLFSCGLRRCARQASIVLIPILCQRFADRLCALPLLQEYMYTVVVILHSYHVDDLQSSVLCLDPQTVEPSSDDLMLRLERQQKE